MTRGITVQRSGDWLAIWFDGTKVLDVYINDPKLTSAAGVTRSLADMKAFAAFDSELPA